MTMTDGRPDTMRVVRLRGPGGPGQLVIEEAGRPRPGPGEALVRVHAAAITRDELQWPVDRLPAIPSYELAGVVEEAGPGVAGVAPGDEVFALTPFDRDGVAADFAIVPAEGPAARPRARTPAGGEAAVAQPRRERCCPPAHADRLAGAVRPRPARSGRARADPRCRGRGGWPRGPARAQTRCVCRRDRSGDGTRTGARARRTGGRRRGDGLRGRGGARRPRVRHRWRRAAAPVRRCAAPRGATGLRGGGAAGWRRVLHRRA